MGMTESWHRAEAWRGKKLPNESAMKSPNFFAELKRRNVYKVAVAYGVVGWLIVQVGTSVLPTFHTPDWVAQTLIVLVLLGFPVALVIAWAFEMTPEGMKRTENISPDEQLPQWSKRKFAAVFATLALIAAALLTFRMVGTARWAVRTEGDDGHRSAVSLPIPEKSIAVLPFENLSEDKDNAYFVEGMQDEILTRLSKIATLKVISRTSTLKYKSAPDNLREVGKQLGVANLVEGSVQKIGNAAHINVQLIRVATDEHLWAESYNRKLDDIFAVEGEVAGAIADQLNAKLSGSEKQELAVRPTKNPDAYDAYLRGLAFQGGVDDFQGSLLKSIEAFEDAVRLDPEFALAWAHLCRQDGLVFINFDQSSQRREMAHQALDMAMKLGPDLVETKLANGFYKYFVERDYEGAKAQLETVHQQYPNNAVAVEFLGGLARRQGRWEDSRRFYAQAIELDPQNVFLLTDASLTDLDTRDAVAAQKHLGRARDLSPQNSTVIGFLAISFQLTGDIAQAQTLLDTIQPKRGDGLYVGIVATNAIFLRKYDSAIAALKEQLRDPKALGITLGNFENILGDLERHAGHAAEAAAAYETTKQTVNELLRTQPDNTEFLNAGLGGDLARRQGQRDRTRATGDYHPAGFQGRGRRPFLRGFPRPHRGSFRRQGERDQRTATPAQHLL